jgi:hypothetical protein
MAIIPPPPKNLALVFALVARAKLVTLVIPVSGQNEKRPMNPHFIGLSIIPQGATKGLKIP